MLALAAEATLQPEEIQHLSALHHLTNLFQKKQESPGMQVQ